MRVLQQHVVDGQQQAVAQFVIEPVRQPGCAEFVACGAP